MEKGTTKSVVYPELLWAGTDHSLQVALQAHAARAGLFSSSDQGEDDDEDLPYMLSIQDNIGVVTVRGPLVNNSDPWNKYLGVSGYPDIRSALISAAENESIKAILMDIHSGGGTVSGVSDTADLISSINKSIKPVWAVTDGTMASAAYWLGCSAQQVYASDTSIVGSVGVICTHMEYSKALKEAGIGVNVLRAGEYKALANPYEPLSETAQRQIQDQLNSAYQIFIGHVAEARGTTVNIADQRMGQGREFFGAQAAEAGLVDGIMSFDKVFGVLSAKVLDTGGVTQNNYGQYLQGPGMTRKALSTAQIAAAAVGAVISDVTQGGPGMTRKALSTAQIAAAAVGAVISDVTQGGATAPAAETSTEVPAAETTAASTETTAAPAASGPSPELVSMLQTQLAEANARVVSLSVELSQANQKVAAMQPQVDGLKAIAGRSLSTMKVALGHSAVDATLMSVDNLLSDHATTTDAFQKAFVVGGVAAVSATESAEEQTTTNPALRRAQLSSARVGR